MAGWGPQRPQSQGVGRGTTCYIGSVGDFEKNTFPVHARMGELHAELAPSLVFLIDATHKVTLPAAGYFSHKIEIHHLTR